MRQAQTCPYLQGAPDVIASAVGLTERGIRHIAPTLHFKRGLKHLRRVFAQVGKELGRSRRESLAALEVGLKTVREFRAQGRAARLGSAEQSGAGSDGVHRGRAALHCLGPGAEHGHRQEDSGPRHTGHPTGFLPLEAADISDVWPNAYSRQIQKKLMAARLIRQDSRLRAWC